MTYRKLTPLALALGICAFAMTGPTPTQAAPISSGLSSIADATPDLVTQIQRGRRGGARVGRGGGRVVGRRGGRGIGFGAAAVGTGLAIGILGAAAAAAADAEARRAPQCRYVDPDTGRRFWAPCQ
jgi:hypothetical protein